MRKTHSKLFIITGFVYFILSGNVFSQSTFSSPYSAFGLGKLYQSNNMRNSSMGRIGYGIRDYFTVNVKNPASYTAFDSTSFIFEGSVIGDITTMKTADLNEQYSYATLNNLLFGFPVTNWWRSSFGLIPFSNVGYNVVDTEIENNFGKTSYAFEGEGGLSEVYWGNAFSLGKHLSLGVNASYLFGSLERIQKISFPDSTNMVNSRFDNTLTLKDVKFEFGAQYYTNISNNVELIVGAVYRPEQTLNANRDELVRSYRGGGNTLERIIDTIRIALDHEGTVTMPMGIGLGFSLSERNKWLFGVDYSFDQWENYKAFDRQDSLTNRHMLNIGGQLIPDANSLSYYKRIDYRLGFKYNMSHLDFRNEQLNGFGITFGVGLPLRTLAIRGSRAMVNLGVEYGSFGTTAKNLIREDYVNVFIGVSIYEWWFFKRKYN